MILAIAWTVVITVLSLITIGKIGSSIPIAGKDKIVHFIFYFLFVILWYYYSKSKTVTNQITFQIVAIAIAYGIIMEICQSIFTQNRVADIYDAIANSIGAITAFLYLKLKNEQ